MMINTVAARREVEATDDQLHRSLQRHRLPAYPPRRARLRPA
jgi:hypothetical protein